MHRKGTGDSHALLLPTGQLRRHFTGLRINTYTRQKLHRLILRFTFLHMAHFDRGKRHIIKDVLIRKQVELLENHTDFSTQVSEGLALLRKRLTVNKDGTGINSFKPVNGTAHSRFTGT